MNEVKNSTQPRIPVLYKAVLINNSQPFLICSFTGLGLVRDSQNPVLSVFFSYLYAWILSKCDFFLKLP